MELSVGRSSMVEHQDTEMVMDTVGVENILGEGDAAALRRDISWRLDQGQSPEAVADWASQQVDGAL